MSLLEASLQQAIHDGVDLNGVFLVVHLKALRYKSSWMPRYLKLLSTVNQKYIRFECFQIAEFMASGVGHLGVYYTSDFPNHYLTLKDTWRFVCGREFAKRYNQAAKRTVGCKIHAFWIIKCNQLKAQNLKFPHTVRTFSVSHFKQKERYSKMRKKRKIFLL
jgi:hypothetical protein